MQLTPERLREVLHYDPATGDFTWLTPAQGRRVNGKAGHVRRGYLFITVLGHKSIPATHLAWMLTHGHRPNGVIDHINGDTLDNRLANLRDVDPKTNAENQRRPQRDNLTGYLGVSPQKGRYRAQIQHAGRAQYLGMFGTPEEAHEAYLDAKRKLHVGCTI